MSCRKMAQTSALLLLACYEERRNRASPLPCCFRQESQYKPM
jgi:hypothetical protein